MGQYSSVLRYLEEGGSLSSLNDVESVGDNPLAPNRKKRRRELRERLNQPQDKLFDYCLKIIIVGDSNCGKTCILKHFQTSNFPTEQAHTVGVEFGSKIVQIGDKKIKLQLWDTAVCIYSCYELRICYLNCLHVHSKVDTINYYSHAALAENRDKNGTGALLDHTIMELLEQS